MHVNPKISASKLIHLVLFLVPLVASDHCSKNPVIFNFGDSNSDTGGYVAAHGSDLGYPYGRAFFHQSTGRFSDGRLIIDFLCENLKANYLTNYLDALEPNFTNGVNFAISGAATHPLGALFSLDIQILQFKRFKSRSTKLKSEGVSGLIGEEDFKNALYTIDIGQNDLSFAFNSFSYSEAIDKIPSYLSEIKNAMWDIYLLGGRNFWVHNTGPMGCLPRQLAIGNNVQANDFDQYGCMKSLNEGAKLFNSKLNALCQELRSEMENSTIVYVDVYSIKYNLIANSTLYGFENPLMACCGEGGPPYNYNPDNDCVRGGCLAFGDETPYISWDGTHYTEDANAIIASKILSTQYSTPPFDFNFFCIDANCNDPHLLVN